MTTAERPLVSVVTPFYNTKDYLAEAIESVLAQTYRHFEYLLVDNISTDGSADIAHHYAELDDRIRVVKNPEFVSQPANYNGALAQVPPRADYIKILQADDKLFPRCLEEMVALMEAQPTAGFVSSYRLRGRRVECVGLPHSTACVPGREAARRHLLGEFFLFGSATTIMYRAGVVRARRPFYSETSYHEDTEAAYEILAAHDLGFVHQVLSFTRMQEESISGAVRDYQPDVLDQLIAIRRYGRLFLTRAEYEKRSKEIEGLYYRTLAVAWLDRREKAFFDYHRKGLAMIGEDIDRGKLLHHAARAATSRLLRPADAAASIVRRGREFLRGS